MSIAACAQKVQQGDPDRFRVVMSAPVPVRRVLFPIHAMGLEVARAPWVTQEPLIAQMRLQWWHDVLDEIAGAGQPRRHEVVDALAEVLTPDAARHLQQTVATRQWDIHKDPFEDDSHFHDYITATSATPLEATLMALGDDPAPAGPAGYAIGLARYLQAVPDLEAKGRIPLLDGHPTAIAALARDALAALKPLPATAKATCTELALAKPILKRAAKQPQRVAQGNLALSDFGKRWRLLLS